MGKKSLSSCSLVLLSYLRWQCVDEGQKHLDRILTHTIKLHEHSELFEDYRVFETEGRGHGPGAKKKCGKRSVQVSEALRQALQPNATVRLDDRRPCHSTLSFISTGQASHHILGSSGTHFATTHHLGSISYRKNGTPCSRKLKELVSSTLKHGGLQYTDADDSFRGLYWYPPNGFTEWHTDGGQVEGWRLYLTDVEEENQSGFVYQAKDGVRRVGDRKFQANMFRLVRGKSLWHAVYSTNTTRFSMGIAISHGLAMKIVRQLNKLPSR
uniref:Prolyl 4-hydroxylase alpha subunit Fe(2+) 2OG dioxygenase domain-containing protein n=2 Tax=Guillardia theta TaxID=55529 RepID=A0A6U5ZD66_GUITH|mmetsp:Transcript_25072/g.82694  ORF Transcript_25072/g.82694 Transcript_25072/m.82694 type:complete len:269 (+) Transcript_25072:586-1392(+)